MGEQVSERYIAVGLQKRGRVFLPFSGILSVLSVPPRRTLRLIASHLAKQLQQLFSPPAASRRAGRRGGRRVRRQLVYNHWLHPDKLGGGRMLGWSKRKPPYLVVIMFCLHKIWIAGGTA